MDQNRKDNIRLLLDIISKLAIVVVGIWGVWQYSDIKTKEYQKPLWETQIRIYIEVADLVSRLTNEITIAKWEADKIRFYELYWGSMILIEDNAVETAMVNFGNHLYDFDKIKNPEQKEEVRKKLRKYAHELSYALRDSINRGIESHKPSMRLRTDLK